MLFEVVLYIMFKPMECVQKYISSLLDDLQMVFSEMDYCTHGCLLK